MIYVQLPDEFVAIRWPGYYWHLDEKKLYSLKSGVLKPLKLKKKTFVREFSSRLVSYNEPSYTISHLGRNRIVWLYNLMKLKPPKKMQTVRRFENSPPAIKTDVDIVKAIS